MKELKYYSIEKLNESNYRSWSQVVESHLDDQELWKVVQGKDQKPECPTTSTTTSTAQTSKQTATAEMAAEMAAAIEVYEEKLEAWTKKAKKAQTMIISMISP